MTSQIPSAIFNTNKTDYKNQPLFLGQKPGLFDTVNKQYPQVWKLYKGMKQLDWDENEFVYADSASDFVNLPKNKVSKMIKSLAWQWEMDSIATRSIAFIVGLFDPAPEVWAAWLRISDNETVHAATYSEIVRNSFSNPHEVLKEILSVVESMQRMETVTRELEAIRKRGLEYQLGLVPNDQETYNAIFMFTFIMYCMERIQFMASFAVTFALGEESLFTQPVKGVQKIAVDEYEIHVSMDKAILEHELTTERGQEAYRQLRPKMNKILNEIVNTELGFTDFVFEDGETLDYLSCASLKEWVKFSATNVAIPMNLDLDCGTVNVSPLHYMKNWINISDFQASPQSEENGQYKVNLLRRDDEEVDFEVNF